MTLSGLFKLSAVALPALLAGGGAMAQTVMTVPAGTVVMVLPARTVPIEPVAAPAMPDIARLIAEQRAIMTRMMADMDSLFAPIANGPLSGAVPVDLGSAAAARNGVLVCQRSVTIRYDGTSNFPVMKVTAAGSGCGSETPSAPAPASAPSPVTPGSPRGLIEVKAPAAAHPTPVRRAT